MKKKYLISGILTVSALSLAALLLFVTKGEKTAKISSNPILNSDSLNVGSQVADEDITDFYYTYDSSANPPIFQRYRFYAEDGKFFFYHEKREGDHWPLTEDDITSSGRSELSEHEWNAFLSYVEGGTVQKMTESSDTGNAGPWLFLYWKGDGGKMRKFTFASYEKQHDFEQLCRSLTV